MSIGDRTPAGKTRADLAVELLDRVDRRITDPNAVAVAQVHATLAVAEVLLDIHSRLGDLVYGGRRATPPASPLGDATSVRSARPLAG